MRRRKRGRRDMRRRKRGGRTEEEYKEEGSGWITKVLIARFIVKKKCYRLEKYFLILSLYSTMEALDFLLANISFYLLLRQSLFM